jgi:hypothetical protein
MTMYLSNHDVRPTGYEGGEFIDDAMLDVLAPGTPVTGTPVADSTVADSTVATSETDVATVAAALQRLHRAETRQP